MMESMRNLHIVLFIGVMCVVQTMSQVCPYSDPRCKCSSDRVLCELLDQIPPLNTGANVIQVSYLEFNSGNITIISKNSLPPGLESIAVYNHPLTNISEDAFDTSAATLQYLNFNYVHFNSLPPALKKLTKLTSLTIQYTKIQDWDTATLKQIATTLERLVLMDVGLSTWPNWIVYFQLLREVQLSRNFLYAIPDDAFSSIEDSLSLLVLSSTGLTHIPQALFTLSSLTYLYLDKNNFTDMTEIEKISGLPFAQKLSVLSLGSVGMYRIANFSNLSNLTRINLSGNRISDVPTGLLPTSLTSLDISENSISCVPKVLATMSSLSTLYISNNLITDIEQNSFPSSLTYLDLGSNNLSTITNRTFRSLNLLQTLYLDSNPITTVSPEAFSGLVSLQRIQITDSQLIEIPLAFARLNSHVDIHFFTTQPLACPCPVFHELVQWFTSHVGALNIDATCNGQSIDSYLSGQCDHSLATL